MTTSAATLVQRTRRYLRDWPEGDSLTASQSSGATTFTVADALIYGPGQLVQIDSEAMQIRSVSGVTVTVLRGARGTTAAAHASGATVLMRPRFLDVDIIDSLNTALDACYPLIYRHVSNEYTGVTDGTYEYDIPTDTTINVPIRYISKVEVKVTGDLAYRKIYDWTIFRGSTPFIKLRRPLPNGNLRIVGMGPFAHLTDSTSSLDSLFPLNAEDLLIDYAGQRLLLSGEAARVREDTGARDQRENANRTGSSASASNAFFQRWNVRLRAASMPPMGPHVVSVL